MRTPSLFRAFLVAVFAAFALVAGLPIVQPVQAVAAVVASVAEGSPDGNGFTSSGSINSTGAVRVSLWLCYFGSPTVSDSKGNTLAGRTEYASNTRRARLFEDTTPVVGTSHTFTVTGASTYAVGILIAWSGTDAADQESASATDSVDDPVTPGSITPSTNNQIVFTGNMGDPDSTAFVTPSGYTDLGKVDASANTVGCAAAYQVQTTATATNPSWDRTTSGSYTIAHVLSISASVAAGPPPGSRGLKGAGR